MLIDLIKGYGTEDDGWLEGWVEKVSGGRRLI